MKRKRAEDLQGGANLSAPSMMRRKSGYLFTITASPPPLMLSRRILPVLQAIRPFSTTAQWRNTSSHSSDGEQTIHDKLTAQFAPSHLKVLDVSGSFQTSVVHFRSIRSKMFLFLGGCGSFYAITIASESFKGLSTVKQHKLVTEALKQEIEGIHGLQVPPAFYFPALQDLLILPTD